MRQTGANYRITRSRHGQPLTSADEAAIQLAVNQCYARVLATCWARDDADAERGTDAAERKTG